MAFVALKYCFVVLLLVLPLGDGFQSQHLITFSRTLCLEAKRSKEELNSLVTSVGLKPATKLHKSNGQKLNSNLKSNLNSNPKSKPSQNQPSSKSGDRPTNTGKVPIEVPIEVQLEYARNGSAVLRSFLDPTLLQAIRAHIVTYSEKKELEAWRQKVEVGSNDPQRAKACRTIRDCKQELENLHIGLDNLPFLQYFNTWRDVTSVRELCYALGQTASVLLDVPEVRLYQDALFTKRANDGQTPWHTDARMAPFDTSNILTFWIPLQEIPKNGTALIFVPKSHNDFALPFWNDFDGPEYDRLEQRYKEKTVHYMPMNLGDMTVHSGWTLHCANGNDATEHRHALAISFVDARAQIRETALDFSPSDGGGYGDNEDQWSYREWVSQVPRRKPFGTHPLVPIVWPLS